jgi:hypothetical protein
MTESLAFLHFIRVIRGSSPEIPLILNEIPSDIRIGPSINNNSQYDEHLV